MAVIGIDALTIGGTASAAFTARRLAYLKAVPGGSATVSQRNKPYLIKYVRTAIGGSATTSARAINIQKAKAVPSANATISQRNVLYLIKYTRGSFSGSATVTGASNKYKTVRGALGGSASVEAYQTQRDIPAAVRDFLPVYYRDFDDVNAMLQTTSNESTRLHAKINDLLDQFYVNSATGGLTRWNTLTGIEEIPQRSTDSQRHYINAKLRGLGTTTPQSVDSIANSFYACETTEKPSEYAVDIKIVGKRGVPKNLEDMDESLEAVMPAHIAHNWEFTYLPWSEVTQAGLVWRDADEYTAEGLEKAFLL